MNVLAPRSLLRLTARLLLAVLLFAQFALTAQACTGPRDLGGTLRHDPAVPAGEAAAPACHHAHGSHHAAAQGDGAMSANLCVAHCTAGDQTADTPQVSVADAPALPVLSVALPLLPAEALPARALESPRQAGPPPVPILFGIFRS